MLRHEISMLAQPITRALELNYNGVMQKAVEQRGRDYGIPEHRRLPLFSTGWYLTSRSPIRLMPFMANGLRSYRSALRAVRALLLLSCQMVGGARSADPQPILVVQPHRCPAQSWICCASTSAHYFHWRSI